MTKKLLGLLTMVLLFGHTAQAGLILTMQETVNGTVDLTIDAFGTFDGSIPLDHLDYQFFDDLGDFVNDSELPNFNPFFFTPSFHPQIGEDVRIQVLGVDNDTDVAGDLDDLFIRFIGTTDGLSNGDSLGGAFDLLSVTNIPLFNTQFSWLNPGVYFANDDTATAFGGLELRVVPFNQVPLPTTLWLLLIGFTSMKFSTWQRSRSTL